MSLPAWPAMALARPRHMCQYLNNMVILYIMVCFKLRAHLQTSSISRVMMMRGGTSADEGVPRAGGVNGEERRGDVTQGKEREREKKAAGRG